jgi:two-component system sensor histidine kinase ArlS
VTIRAKITLLFTVLVTAVLLLTAYFVYYFSALQRESVFQQRLSGRAHNAAKLFDILGDSSAATLLRVDASNARFFTNKAIHIYSTDHQKIYEFNTSPADDFKLTDAELEEIKSRKEYFFKINERDAFGQLEEEGRFPFIIVVAAYDSDGQQWLANLEKILAGSLVAGIGLSLLAGYLFSRQLVKPITAIIEEVNTVSSHNLSHRIDAGSGQDELYQLANTFNDLLNRLQESFEIQRRFISNASHELSTPLTSISSQLEVTLQKKRTEEEYRAVLESVQEDVIQMRQLTKSLLEIAKTGTQGSIELNEVRLDEVLLKITAAVKKLFPEYQVLLHFDELPDDESKCMVFGNADLLYSALSNIIENGCKYSSDHTSRVTLRFGENDLTVDVVNYGDVIAEEEIKNIFLPFYRSPGSQLQKGFGLGLALAKRIIGMHKGSIEVKSGDAEGTLFRIVLPSARKFM